MSPRLLTTVRRRFRISDDILVLILEYLDPMDLVKACKVLSSLLFSRSLFPPLTIVVGS